MPNHCGNTSTGSCLRQPDRHDSNKALPALLISEAVRLAMLCLARLHIACLAQLNWAQLWSAPHRLACFALIG